MLDSNRYKDPWFACQQLLDNLITTSTQIISEVSTSCSAYPRSIEYNEDPCCNYLTDWAMVCVPRPVNVSRLKSEVNSALVRQQCSNPGKKSERKKN